MKTVRKVLALVMVMMLTMAMWGCGQKNETASGNAEATKDAAADTKATDAADDSAATTDAAASDELIVIGFSQVGAESDWRVANTESMQSTLSAENGFELIFSDAQQKQENQIKAIRNFISQDVDVIALAPVVETGWETVLGEAKDAGIPVIIVDRMIDVTDDSLYTCWVGSDFLQEGYDAVDWLVGYMDGLGRGNEDLNVAMLQGTIGASAEIGRTKGVEEKLAEHKNYKLVLKQTGEFTQAKGQEVMESFLKSGEDIDIVIAQNDNMAFGAIDAIKAVGKVPGKDIIIVSFDAVHAAFESMIAGDMNVSVECNPLHGPKVAEIAKSIMAGQEVTKMQYVEEDVFPADTAKDIIDTRAY